ncbi:MAG: AarF/ABC1/UbiB kinase family protein, partial [Acidobacteriota bacterium]
MTRHDTTTTRRSGSEPMDGATLWVPSLKRFARLVGVLARHALAVGLGSLLERLPRLAHRLPAAEMPEPERLRSILEELGGTFLKLGQMLALQPDILPQQYCTELYRLLDRVPPFSTAGVEQVFVEELGRTPAELFDRFEPRPIAAATIGPVHVATLTGRKVAVKVQRPTAERDFGGDVRLMELAISLIRRLRLRRLDCLIEPMVDVIEWTREELDYRQEAHFMEQLRLGSRHRPHQRVPEVVQPYLTRRVLVMELFEGVTLLDYLRAVEPGKEKETQPEVPGRETHRQETHHQETHHQETHHQETLRRLAAFGFQPDRFAAHVIDNFFYQSLAYGLYHADIHPANLMILPGNVVGYLDLGITGTLSPYSRRHLAALTLACTRGDLEGMAAAFQRISSADAAAAQRYCAGLARLSD